METPQTELSLILSEISALQRDPFRKELARLLHCAPTDEALQKFADKSPDRWAQAVSILMRGAGYTEKMGNETNIYVQINQMSDSAIDVELQRIENLLQTMGEQHGEEETRVIESRPEEETCPTEENPARLRSETECPDPDLS